MPITMSSKYQIAIPKKIAMLLGLKKGSMFRVEIRNNRIELIPLEVVEKIFTDEEYKKLEMLSSREHGLEKKVTKKFIDDVKRG